MLSRTEGSAVLRGSRPRSDVVNTVEMEMSNILKTVQRIQELDDFSGHRYFCVLSCSRQASVSCVFEGHGSCSSVSNLPMGLDDFNDHVIPSLFLHMACSRCCMIYIMADATAADTVFRNGCRNSRRQRQQAASCPECQGLASKVRVMSCVRSRCRSRCNVKSQQWSWSYQAALCSARMPWPRRNFPLFPA